MATQEQYNPPEGPEASPPKRARRRAAKPTTGAENALAAFDELNGRHAVLTCENGKCVVGTWTKEVVAGGQLRERVQIQSFADIGNTYLNRRVSVNDRPETLGKAWLQWPERRTYERLVFVPNGAPVIENCLNHAYPVDTHKHFC